MTPKACIIKHQASLKDAIKSLTYLDRQLCRCPQDPEHVDIVLELIDVASCTLSEDVVPLLETIYDEMDSMYESIDDTLDDEDEIA